MTPQEQFEYKNKWRPNAWTCFIDPDADVWAKTWCRKHLERPEWAFESYARPDDWHQMLFHNRGDFMSFKAAYNLEFTVQI